MESQPHGLAARGGPRRSNPPSECSGGASIGSLAEAANDTRMSQLARTIEQEIIPRLMLAHRAGTVDASVAVPRATTLGADEVRQFVKIILGGEEEPAFTAVFAYRNGGVPIERIYLDLLAPTARVLGELWTEDLCSFTDVTVGLGRLQRILRELSPSLGASVEHPGDGRSVLLLPAPGEQHTFGLVMVAEFFRSSGWSVGGGSWTPGAEAAKLVAAEWFDVVGFSLGAEVHLGALADGIRAVKHETCNPNIVVLVGGPLFTAHPEHVETVGADGMTSDGREAPALAERLISRDASIRAGRRAAASPGGPF